MSARRREAAASAAERKFAEAVARNTATAAAKSVSYVLGSDLTWDPDHVKYAGKASPEQYLADIIEEAILAAIDLPNPDKAAG